MIGTAVIGKIKTISAQFKRNDNGNIAVIAAICLMPILIAVGAAIDYSRIFLARTTLTAALDAAVLSASKGLTQVP